MKELDNKQVLGHPCFSKLSSTLCNVQFHSRLLDFHLVVSHTDAVEAMTGT